MSTVMKSSKLAEIEKVDHKVSMSLICNYSTLNIPVYTQTNAEIKTKG